MRSLNNYYLTQEYIDGVILTEEYATIGKKTVVCVLTLENGFEVVGSASCIDPENFDFEIGQELAYEDAVNQIWKLEGYLLQQDKYEDETSKDM